MAKKSEGMTKVAMVEEAITKLGWDASTADLAAYVKSNHGAVMSVAHIAQTKSNLRKKHGVKPKRRRGKGKGKAAAAPVAAASAGTSANMHDIVAFVSAVKDWEQKLGAKSVRDIVKHVLK